MVRKYRKETIAKNLINTVYNLMDLNYLHKPLEDMYDEAKKNREGYEHLMKIYDELYAEFLDDKKKFVKKYAKPHYKIQKDLVDKFLKKEGVWEKISKK